MNRKAFVILLVIFIQFITSSVFSQCCAGGGGNPIAGGVSQGVLLEHQLELGASYQYLSSTKFLTGKEDAKNFLEKFSSDYGYFRLGYGISPRVTFSVETGYYFRKLQVGLDKRLVEETSGIADLILFPRYSFFQHHGDKGNWEAIAGIGLKIPLGNYTDSLEQVEPFSQTKYKIRMAPAVQTSSGALDGIVYLSVLRSFNKSGIKLFGNALYIRKGWNPVSERTGDYTSVSIFAGRKIYRKFGAVLQVKSEWIGKMEINPELLYIGYYNHDVDATGSKKVFVVPQLNYNRKNSTLFIASEFPVYQFVNKTQIASQYLFTFGMSHRFAF